MVVFVLLLIKTHPPKEGGGARATTYNDGREA
jgi:hypothetical protein